MALIASLLNGAAAESGKWFLPRLLEGAARPVKTILQTWNVAAGLDRLEQVRQVKPIWNPGRLTDLHDIYEPCKLYEGPRRRAAPTDLADLGGDHVLVVGNVGQGKSMLLRYLASNELRLARAGGKARPLPLFLELRHLKRGELISAFAQRSLSEIGLPCGQAVFEHFAKRGRLALLLDGFDELPSHARGQVAHDLERLAVQFGKLGVVVTSRPNVSGIEHMGGFSLRRLLDLDDETRARLIAKQYAPTEAEAARRLAAELAVSKIGRLVKTPLMTILIVIHYNTYQTLPNDVGAFHEDLFDALLRRHDATKPGFVRPRESQMDDMAFRMWFDRFCFFAMKSERIAFPRYEALEIADKAMSRRGAGGAADRALADAVYVTGLVLQEGGEYQFIHKSIVEYHAASYIRRLTDKVARKFYSWVQAHDRFAWWDEVIVFLRQIDRARYLRLFELPQINRCVVEPLMSQAFRCGPVTFTAQPRSLSIGAGWLLKSWHRTPNLQKVLLEYFGRRAGELSYDETGRRGITADELDRAGEDPNVVKEWRALLAWCRRKHGETTAEISEVDDPAEVLEIDDEEWA